jgi:hypothetical protein
MLRYIFALTLILQTLPSLSMVIEEYSIADAFTNASTNTQSVQFDIEVNDNGYENECEQCLIWFTPNQSKANGDKALIGGTISNGQGALVRMKIDNEIFSGRCKIIVNGRFCELVFDRHSTSKIYEKVRNAKNYISVEFTNNLYSSGTKQPTFTRVTIWKGEIKNRLLFGDTNHTNFVNLKKSANDGDLEAQINLAQMYIDGDIVPRDTSEAKKHLDLAVKNVVGSNNLKEKAMVKLGMVYEYGLGNGNYMSKNPEKAYYWYYKASKLGNNHKSISLKNKLYGTLSKFKIEEAEDWANGCETNLFTKQKTCKYE